MEPRQTPGNLAGGAGLTLIAGLGLALRLFQLGSDSFWCDEAGVADIAAQPTAGQALAALRHHVLAMPLDYLLSWLAARFGGGEFIQRLPAALWGTLAIVACFLLGRRLLPAGSRLAAGWAALLLALSPLHIEYSQELRFYAALVFWHALALWLFLRALDSGRRRDFALCAAAGLLGVYFHIYVALAALPMLGWALGAGRVDGDGAAPGPARLRPA
ncbi:MAG TPA: glycosyltransferase family 39 protein, partial [Herpetosiphonaceae bacterium]